MVGMYTQYLGIPKVQYISSNPWYGVQVVLVRYTMYDISYYILISVCA